MKCRDVMTADPVCCLPSETASRIAKLMKTEDVGSVPICEDRQTRRLVGIVTDRDLALTIVAEGRDAHTTRAEDVMTRSPVTCRAEDNVQTALHAMEANQVRRIPVVGENGRLVGIIAQADIAIRLRKPDSTAEVVEEISRPTSKAA